MFRLPVDSRFGRLLARFVSAEQGNIAVIFAITLLPILCMVGAAVDYSRASRARSSMQAALDSTALMLSKDLTAGTITTSDISTKALSYFSGLYTDTEAKGVNISPTYTAATTSAAATLLLNGSGYITSDFMQIAGFPTLGFNTTSTSTWGNAKMRVALVLDNTGSMAQDGKITALRNAVAGSGGLIDQLSALSKNSGDVYISVVPFAKDVNVGSSNYAQSWIDWTSWEAEAPDLVSSKPSNWANIGPGSNCPWTMSNNGFTCVNGPGSTSAVSTIPNSGSNKGLICPGTNGGGSYKYHYLINGCYNSVASGSTYTHTWQPNSHSTWSGCITDRTQPYDAQSTAPNTSTVATLFPAEQYYENSTSFCSSSASTQLEPIIPLSYNWSALKTAVNAMQPTGGTNQVVGLAWGWLSLLQSAPLNAPAESGTSGTTYNRVIILLSDGLNTENRWPAYGDGSSQTTTYGNSTFPGSIDARQQVLCDNLHNARDSGGAPMYTIYTIQVNTSSPADPTSAILKYCASSPDKFYMLTSSSQIVTTFNTIGTALSKLRLAR
ncbi:TadE/TadG family protein [Bradyrhizobium rifense]|uniref:TadE/TadG family protein n=1 Tax=Bradyrhizobium rifense TaxID=515499 RepID=A0A5D3KCZ7_9BRAD|nr:pilus assembly protein [Bradyrhizobium rifense]TYL94166.1 TadE/TadG family protein [Bradyrhizobium rifense]